MQKSLFTCVGLLCLSSSGYILKKVIMQMSRDHGNEAASKIRLEEW